MTLPRLSAFVALVAVAACASGEVNRARMLDTDTSPILPPTASIPVAPEQLREIAASGTGQPLMIARMGDGATMSMTAETAGDRAVWTAPDGRRLFMENDVIVATQSMGEDLMAMEAPRKPVQERVGETYVRSYQHNTPDQVVVTNFDCEMQAAGSETVRVMEASVDTTRLVESCAGPDGRQFQNAYWVDGGGDVRQSREWVNARLGTVEMLRLIQ